jgi:hypothetical protein
VFVIGMATGVAQYLCRFSMGEVMGRNEKRAARARICSLVGGDEVRQTKGFPRRPFIGDRFDNLL